MGQRFRAGHAAPRYDDLREFLFGADPPPRLGSVDMEEQSPTEPPRRPAPKSTRRSGPAKAAFASAPDPDTHPAGEPAATPRPGAGTTPPTVLFQPPAELKPAPSDSPPDARVEAPSRAPEQEIPTPPAQGQGPELSGRTQPIMATSRPPEMADEPEGPDPAPGSRMTAGQKTTQETGTAKKTSTARKTSTAKQASAAKQTSTGKRTSATKAANATKKTAAKTTTSRTESTTRKAASATKPAATRADMPEGSATVADDATAATAGSTVGEATAPAARDFRIGAATEADVPEQAGTAEDADLPEQAGAADEASALALAGPRRSARRRPHPSTARRVIDHPGYLPELLALAAVDGLGPPARAWAARIRTVYPGATTDGLARLATQRYVRLAVTGATLSTATGLLAPLAGLAAVTWAQAGLVLHLAAAHGHDPTQPDRAADLLLLTRVHSDEETARAALAAAAAAVGGGDDGSGEEDGAGDGTVARLAEAGWRLGAPIVARTTNWLALRLAVRRLPGATTLATAMLSSASTERLAARATAHYRAGTLQSSTGTATRRSEDNRS